MEVTETEEGEERKRVKRQDRQENAPWDLQWRSLKRSSQGQQCDMADVASLFL